jgi:ribosomal protein S27AE
MSRDKKKGKFRFLGIDPTLGISHKVLDHIEEAQEKEKKKLEKSNYYVICPNCGKKQIKRNLIENGCFICDWKGTEENIELVRAKLQSGEGGAKIKNLGYKINCPNCGASVVTEEFLKNGCYRCGYKEKD